ncbi:MAG: type I methionyl aminopeptidase [Candidatus Omnitrophica bacterium 4484_213]|nr:MAG: type I methionyl aminopeptidase [Candidatus Omnitrophica bacterium 4484_213]
MIILKTDKEIELMRQAGQIVAYVWEKLREKVRPGISGEELNNYAEELILKKGAIPVFKGYQGFPAAICVSTNEVVVHGVPSKKKLKEGDIVSLDVGVRYKGYCGDGAITLPVGRVSPEAKRLIEVTRKALFKAIKQAKPGNRLSDISWAVQSFVEEQRFSVIRKFVGHGIGKEIHEDPRIPNFGKPHQGVVLEKGMVFCIEPMVSAGRYEVEIGPDGWTAATKDKSLSAHFEHMIAIRDKGAEILTKM